MITKGKWELTKHRPLDNIVIAVKNGEEDYLDDTICQMSAYKTANEDAEFIVSACNACKSINEEHPELVAQNIKDMYEALKRALEDLKDLSPDRTNARTIYLVEQVVSKIKGGE